MTVILIHLPISFDQFACRSVCLLISLLVDQFSCWSV